MLFVNCLLTTHGNFTSMVEKAFKSDPSFVEALDRACRKFVNHNAVTQKYKSTAKSPELLAKYCDSLLKKSSKNDDAGEIEKLLDGVMTVFRCVASPLCCHVHVRTWAPTHECMLD